MASFRLDGRTAVITGGCGVLGGTIAEGLAAAGARIVVLDRRLEAAQEKARELRGTGGEAIGLVCDVLEEEQVDAAVTEVIRRCDRVDILVNAAGGNVARSRSDDRSVFEVALDAHEEVLRLNLHGTVLPTLKFAARMAEQGSGSVVNISSMAATRTLTGVLGYSMAKAGVEAFTRWLAVELARRHGDAVRVNAVAPGFFVTAQNRAVLVAEDGTPTARAQQILAHTPMGRFGRPEEVVGAVQWLCSGAAAFVTGVVIPVDGGFSAYGGV